MKRLLLLGIAAIFLVSLNSCKDGETPIGWEDQSMIMGSGLDELYIYDTEEILDYNMECLGSNAQASPRFGEDRGKGQKGKGDWNKGRKHGHQKRFLGYVLYQMELTDAQSDEVKGYFEEYRDCVKTFFESMQAVREEIYAQYQDQIDELRNLIRTDPENRREYFEQLQVIMNEIRAQMRESVDWTDRCDCIKELYEKINGMELTDEQRAIWEEWYNNLDHPCFVDDTEGND